MFFVDVFGDYVLLKKLGSGASAGAFLARTIDQTLGLPVPLVIKRLHPEAAAIEMQLKRFEHEAKIALLVRSSHVARVLDAGVVANEPYLALEYVPGFTLHEIHNALFAAKKRATLAIAAAIADQLLAGLQAIHETRDKDGHSLNITHRDVSSNNVMIADDGCVRVIDLGLGTSATRDFKTAPGVILGSPAYMAPEQAVAEPTSQRTDVYAAAVHLWELLAGVSYIKRSRQAIAMLKQIATRQYQSPGDIPPALDALLRRNLSHDPNERHDSARTTRAALADAVEIAGQEEVRAFVSLVLDENRQARVAEIERLIALEVSVPSRREETRIFARAEHVAAVPTLTEVRPQVSQPIPAPLRRRGYPGWVIALALVTGIGLREGYERLKPPPMPMPTAATPTESTPTAVARPAESHGVVSQPIAEERRTRSRTTRKSLRKTRAKPTVKDPRATPRPPKGAEERLDTYRARLVRAAKGKPTLVSEINNTSFIEDDVVARTKLRDIERRLQSQSKQSR